MADVGQQQSDGADAYRVDAEVENEVVHDGLLLVVMGGASRPSLLSALDFVQDVSGIVDDDDGERAVAIDGNLRSLVHGAGP